METVVSAGTGKNAKVAFYDAINIDPMNIQARRAYAIALTKELDAVAENSLLINSLLMIVLNLYSFLRIEIYQNLLLYLTL